MRAFARCEIWNRSRYFVHPLASRVGDVLADGHVREERVLLEDEPDAPLVGLAEDPALGRSNQVSPSSAIRPLSGRTSPATARSTEVLPAPEGPKSATVPLDSPRGS